MDFSMMSRRSLLKTGAAVMAASATPAPGRTSSPAGPPPSVVRIWVRRSTMSPEGRPLVKGWIEWRRDKKTTA